MTRARDQLRIIAIGAPLGEIADAQEEFEVRKQSSKK